MLLTTLTQKIPPRSPTLVLVKTFGDLQHFIDNVEDVLHSLLVVHIDAAPPQTDGVVNVTGIAPDEGAEHECRRDCQDLPFRHVAEETSIASHRLHKRPVHLVEIVRLLFEACACDLFFAVFTICF